MSAFFVEANTITDAVACLDEAGLIPDNVDKKDLGVALWIMNALALEQRYGDPITEFKEDIDRYTLEPASDNKWQRLKSLQCLIYQCSEGNVPELDTFKTLVKADLILTFKLTGKDNDEDAYAVLNRNKEYDAAQWGRK